VCDSARRVSRSCSASSSSHRLRGWSLRRDFRSNSTFLATRGGSNDSLRLSMDSSAYSRTSSNDTHEDEPSFAAPRTSSWSSSVSVSGSGEVPAELLHVAVGSQRTRGVWQLVVPRRQRPHASGTVMSSPPGCSGCASARRTDFRFRSERMSVDTEQPSPGNSSSALYRVRRAFCRPDESPSSRGCWDRHNHILFPRRTRCHDWQCWSYWISNNPRFTNDDDPHRHWSGVSRK